MPTFNNNKSTVSIKISYPHNTLRVLTALEDLVENLDRIPINDLEELINKYKL